METLLCITDREQELLAIIAREEVQNAELMNCITDQNKRINELNKRISELEMELAKARRNSSNSSKPPSSDIVKPPRNSSNAASISPRKIGGQPGHPKHQRPPFPPEAITQTHDYRLDKCPGCGGQMVEGSAAPRVIQSR